MRCPVLEGLDIMTGNNVISYFRSTANRVNRSTDYEYVEFWKWRFSAAFPDVHFISNFVA